MPVVDPDDDSLDRWIVYRYRFDPDRGHGRNMPVIATDNEPEMREHFARAERQLAEDQRIGEAGRKDVVFAEHRPAGYRASMKRKRRDNPDRLTSWRISPSD